MMGDDTINGLDGQGRKAPEVPAESSKLIAESSDWMLECDQFTARFRLCPASLRLRRCYAAQDDPTSRSAQRTQREEDFFISR
ncbi:MAG: hypothetical protein ACYS0I_17455 [Planctomycetota bacterium]